MDRGRTRRTADVGYFPLFISPHCNRLLAGKPWLLSLSLSYHILHHTASAGGRAAIREERVLRCCVVFLVLPPSVRPRSSFLRRPPYKREGEGETRGYAMVSTGWLNTGIPQRTAIFLFTLFPPLRRQPVVVIGVCALIHPAAPLFSLCPPSLPPFTLLLPSASVLFPRFPPLPPSSSLARSSPLSASIQPYSVAAGSLHLLLLSPLLLRPAAPTPAACFCSSVCRCRRRRRRRRRCRRRRRRRRLPLITTIDLLGARSRISSGAREAPSADCDCSLSLLGQWARALVEFAASIGSSAHSLEAESLALGRPQWPTDNLCCGRKD